MITYLEVECLLYDAQSLKDKRSVIKRLSAKIRRDFNVSIAEIDYQDLWQRTKFGIAIVTNERVYAEQVLQSVLKTIDADHNLERTITHTEQL